MAILIIIGIVLVLYVLNQENKEKQSIVKNASERPKMNVYEAEKQYFALLCEKYLKNKHKDMSYFEFLTKTYLTDQIIGVRLYFKDGSQKNDYFACDCIHYANSPKFQMENKNDKANKNEDPDENEADNWLKEHIIKIEECVKKAKEEGLGIYAYYKLEVVPGALDEILEKLNRNLDWEIKAENDTLVICFEE